MFVLLLVMNACCFSHRSRERLLAASFSPFFPKKSILVSPYPHHGQRVVIGQRMMQAQSDIFLGWSTFNGRHYYGRQLRDMKFSVDVEELEPVRFRAYVQVCGATLARAHARTSDPAQISGYLGNNDTFDQAIADFAEVYADQAERDHAALLSAIKDGRVQAQVGV